MQLMHCLAYVSLAKQGTTPIKPKGEIVRAR